MQMKNKKRKATMNTIALPTAGDLTIFYRPIDFSLKQILGFADGKGGKRAV
jgi:hypothetical protein